MPRLRTCLDLKSIKITEEPSALHTNIQHTTAYNGVQNDFSYLEKKLFLPCGDVIKPQAIARLGFRV